MKVALGSMFRNSSSYLHRYFGQTWNLRHALSLRGDQMQLLLAEGDSTDDTMDKLLGHAASNDVIFKREHGGKHAWHSVDIPERWKTISWVCNGILERVESDVDVFVYVESDLGWDTKTMLRLIDQLNEMHPAIAPMCFTAVGDFYDIWGHIKDGVNFSPFPPYHRALNGGLTEIDSAGSCTAMLGQVVRSGVRYDERDHCRGLGRSIREKGFTLWVDPTLRVIHF